MVVHDARLDPDLTRDPDPQEAKGLGAGRGPSGADARPGHFDRYAREAIEPPLSLKESGTVTHWTESWLGEVLVLSSADTVGAGGCFDGVAAKFL